MKALVEDLPSPVGVMILPDKITLMGDSDQHRGSGGGRQWRRLGPMKIIELGDLDPPQPVSLTDEQGRVLARSGVVTALPSPFMAGHWEVAADGKVGSARVADLEIHIRPKLAVPRLLFLAGYASSGAAWRSDGVGLSEADDLVPALAHALWR